MSVLRQPRWVLFAVITLLICVLFGFLGRWQWHRHEDRRARNQLIEAAVTAAPVPLADVLTSGEPLSATDEYRSVQVQGRYDAAHQLLWRNPNGRSGYDVITPLVTDSGDALLIDRGWSPSSTTDVNTPAADVAPPTGPVEATVRLRATESDDNRVAPNGEIYAVEIGEIASTTGLPLYDAYGELVDQQPEPAAGLELPEPTSLGMGPHLFYAIQWWMFIGIAVAGYFLLVRRESQPDVATPAGSNATDATIT